MNLTKELIVQQKISIFGGEGFFDLKLVVLTKHFLLPIVSCVVGGTDQHVHPKLSHCVLDDVIFGCPTHKGRDLERDFLQEGVSS